MISIINYGSGNINAIANIYDTLKIEYKIVSKSEDLVGSKKVILPGVGAFDETMGMLNKSGFLDVLNHLVLFQKIPVLGICVGMQIMAESSEEGKLEGLGWIKGKVKKFDSNLIEHKPKIPHLGWNSISSTKECDLFNGIDQNDGFYFIHSYFFSATNQEDILAVSNYGIKFSCSVNRNNIYGVQFHPEKSHKNGVLLLKNFAEL